MFHDLLIRDYRVEVKGVSSVLLCSFMRTSLLKETNLEKVKELRNVGCNCYSETPVLEDILSSAVHFFVFLRTKTHFLFSIVMIERKALFSN